MAQLTINKEFAAKYAKKKEAEELSKLRDKYGDSVPEESESSTSEEEDDNAEGVTEKVEREFLRTLSLVKSRDPRIYDKSSQFFSQQVPSGGEGEGEEGGGERRRKKKPMFLRDYERKQLLERGSLAELSDGSDQDIKMTTHQPTYAQEQELLKDSFKHAVEEVEADQSDCSKGDVLQLRHKTAEERREEEREYVEWLCGRGSPSDQQDTRDMETLHSYWTNPNIEPGEEFLRDFILHRGYIDHDTTRTPTYGEIVGSSSDEGAGGRESEDEIAVEKMEEFERKFNFRFEEPDGDLVTSYPRTVAGSVRRTGERTEKRRKKRKEREERKTKEKDQKKEELKRLKNLKKKEIADKLERIKAITGNPDVGFSAKDLEEDFDPEHYDDVMAKMFDESYYADEEETEKPEFSDSGEEGEEEDWDLWQTGRGREGGEEAEPHCEDPEFNMDADYVGGEEEEGAEFRYKRPRKRGSKLAAALRRKKPTFDPKEKSFQEYFDQYYQLEYEDLIGDLPCRFKYRTTTPNDFGLTTEEILMCDDRELNRWASLKKSVQIRTKEEEAKDRRKYRKKAHKKLQILKSLAAPEGEEQTPQKKGRKRERTGGEGETAAGAAKGKGKKPRRTAAGKEGSCGLSGARLTAYGLHKRRRKHITPSQ